MRFFSLTSASRRNDDAPSHVAALQTIVNFVDAFERGGLDGNGRELPRLRERNHLAKLLNVAPKRRLEEHLAICDGCRSVLEQFRVILRITGRLAEDDVTELTPEQREPLTAAFRAWAADR